MTACKHANCAIEEQHVEIRQIDVENGVADSTPGFEPTGLTFFEVNCADCGLIKRYSFSKAPKWLRRYCDQAQTADDDRYIS